MSIRFTERRGKKTVRFDGGTNVGGPQEDWSWEADRQGSQDSATKDSGIDTSSTFTSSEDSNRGDLPKVRARYGPTSRVDRSCINQHFREQIICLSIDESTRQLTKTARVPSISLSLSLSLSLSISISLRVRVLSRAQWKRKKGERKKKKTWSGQSLSIRSELYTCIGWTNVAEWLIRVKGVSVARASRMNKRTRLLLRFHYELCIAFFFLFPPHVASNNRA